MSILSIYFGISLVFMVVVFYLLAKRRSRHKRSYPRVWAEFNDALSRDDIKNIGHFGDLVIWNEYLNQKDKETVYKEIEKRKSNHPELYKLWKDVHYLIHGYEPNET